MIRAVPHLLARALVVAALALTACVGPRSEADPVVKIAFFQDLSVPDHVDLVSPSFLALDTVLQRRLSDRPVVVEVVQFDTEGDAPRAIEMAATVAGDPTFVLAVVAPFWHEPAQVGAILAEAGVPTLSLSPVSASPWSAADPPTGSPERLWRRFVPDRTEEALLVAEIAARRSPDGEPDPVCLVGDGSPYGAGLVEHVETALGDWPSTSVDATDPAEGAATIDAVGCRVVVWGGFPPGARELARAMREAGSARGRPIDVAGDALKTTVPPTSPAGDGVVVGSVACSCVDVSIDVALASRRFVNVYQSEHGLAPGVYAAEAWDAGRLTADALLSGVRTRREMQAAFGALGSIEGVARSYVFDDRGDLAEAEPGLFVAAGTRWLPVPE
jgi:branched-chain amino acid transport system substrate-binding protein